MGGLRATDADPDPTLLSRLSRMTQPMGGLMTSRRRAPKRVVVRETHEPAVPINWTEGHVSVDLTADEVDECIEVSIHGVRHYLHSTTARELSNMLLKRLDEWNTKARAAGWPGA